MSNHIRRVLAATGGPPQYQPGKAGHDGRTRGNQTPLASCTPCSDGNSAERAAPLRLEERQDPEREQPERDENEQPPAER